MATRTQVINGLKTTITQTKTSGQTTTQILYGNTMSYVDKQKNVSLEPKFVKNRFLVKPYKAVHLQTSDNTFKCELKSTRKSDGLKQHAIVEGHGGVYEPLFNLVDIKLPDLSAEVNLAMQEAYAKVDGAVWDVGVDLAELGELRGLEASLTKAPRNFSDLAAEVFDCAKKYGIEDAREMKNAHDVYESESRKRSARRDVKSRASSVPRDLASAWLAYRYGLMPTLLSINDALELLKKKLQKAGSAIHTKRRRKNFHLEKVQMATASKLVSVTYDVRSRIEAIVYYRRYWDQTTMGLLGLTFENIPSILWESTRLSFVWDWIFHIGSWLEALKPKLGCHILGYTSSVKHEVDHTITQCFNLWDQGLSKYVPVPATPVHFMGKSFERSVGGGPVPYPVFTGVEHINVQRAIDAAALAFSPIMKKIRKARLI